ncbi:hypothetical protein R1CP_36915 (plasmid) [Rhodococcus opacus]|uniref:HTH araC/xylS-type domain-containing protein n=1 Tax=Rhodococcus opacus TaxID=37919 RepID=A0A1B1KHB5_RHOOP|nr:AraC family transcriptional regulator [Rhodococcus opacus]ANS31989.1 hypothetical protein R1CP_36915 [Rhodococcus opacus]
MNSSVGSEREWFLNGEVVTTKNSDEMESVVSKVLAPHSLIVSKKMSEFSAAINAIQLGELTVGYLKYDSEVTLILPESSLDTYSINIPLRGRPVSKFSNTVVASTPNLATAFNPGSIVNINWPASCSQLCVKFSRSSIDDELRALLGRDPVRTLRLAEAVPLTPSHYNFWQSTLKLVEALGEITNYPLVTQRIGQILIETLLLTQLNNYSEELLGGASVISPKSVNKAVEYIESHAALPLTTGNIACAAGVSARALQRAFQSHLETTPMDYLRSVRMVRVREQLASSQPGSTTVAAVAYEWGFTHIGRFAKSYRDRFAEYPSQTLRFGNDRNFNP